MIYYRNNQLQKSVIVTKRENATKREINELQQKRRAGLLHHNEPKKKIQNK